MAASKPFVEIVTRGSTIRIARLARWASVLYRLPRAIEREDLEQAGWLALIETEPDDPGRRAWAYRWARAWWAMVNLINTGALGSPTRGRPVYTIEWNTPTQMGRDGEKTITLSEVIPTPDDGDQDLAIDLALACVQVLSPRQERLIALRYIEGHPWTAVARELRFRNQDHARENGVRALNVLRHRLDPSAPMIKFRRRGPPQVLPAPRQSLAAFRAEMTARHEFADMRWAMTHPART